MSREYTNKLYELIGGGELDALQVLDVCLGWMSEADVQDMCLNSDLSELFDEDTDTDTDDDDRS